MDAVSPPFRLQIPKASKCSPASSRSSSISGVTITPPMVLGGNVTLLGGGSGDSFGESLEASPGKRTGPGGQRQVFNLSSSRQVKMLCYELENWALYVGGMVSPF